MTYTEYKYSELAMGGVKARGTVLTGTEINAALKQNGLAGCYRSHFKFTQDFQNYVNASGSVKGYKGSCYTDFFWLDIDHSSEATIEENLPVAIDIAQYYINRLMLEYEIPAEHLRCFFSGRKGFHIGIPAKVFGLTPSKEIPAICKGLAVSLAGDLDYDPSIYDRTRLFRLNNTKHEESGLYKVELEPSEILNCGDVQTILELAKKPRQLDRDYNAEDSYGVLAHLVNEPSENIDGSFDTVDRKSKDNWITDLLENGAVEGGRTNGVMRLAGYYNSKGIPEDVACALIANWDSEKNNPPLAGDPNYPEDKIKTSVASAYQYPGGDSDNDEGLPIPSEIVFQNADSIHLGAAEYVEKFSRKRIKFGYPRIDANSALLGRGEVCIILAYVAVGKTVLAQNIQINAMKKQQVPSIMFSLEMSAMRLYFRQLAILHDKKPSEVEQIFVDGMGDTLANENAACKDIYIVDHVPMSVSLIADCIKQGPTGIELVIVDYVGLLDHPGTNNYERMNNLSRDLVLMAKDLEVAIIAVYQTNRTGANGEIHLGMGRDSGMIEANCDMALGFWEDEKDTRMRYLKLLKARHGQSGVSEQVGFIGDSPKLFAMER